MCRKNKVIRLGKVKGHFVYEGNKVNVCRLNAFQSFRQVWSVKHEANLRYTEMAGLRKPDEWFSFGLIDRESFEKVGANSSRKSDQQGDELKGSGIANRFEFITIHSSIWCFKLIGRSTSVRPINFATSILTARVFTSRQCCKRFRKASSDLETLDNYNYRWANKLQRSGLFVESNQGINSSSRGATSDSILRDGGFSRRRDRDCWCGCLISWPIRGASLHRLPEQIHAFL